MKQGLEKVKKMLLLSQLTIVLLIIVLYWFDSADALELWLQDQWIQSPREVDTRIVILAIDEEALDAIGQWPWSRADFATMINRINSGNPAAIGIDVLWSEQSLDTEGDAFLAQAITDARNIVLPIAGHFDNRGKLIPGVGIKTQTASMPIESLLEGATLGHINTIPDESDGIVRHLLPSIQVEEKVYPAFSVAIANIAMEKLGENLSTQYDKTAIQNWKRLPLIQFTGAARSYPIMSLKYIWNGQLDPKYLKDSIVLIGLVAAGTVQDAYLTPLDHHEPICGIEIHANIIQSLLENRFLVENPWLDSLLILILIGSVLLLGRKLKPQYTGLITLFLAASYMGMAKILGQNGYCITLFYPLLGVVLMNLALLVFRYIESYLEKQQITRTFSKYVAPEVVKELLALGEKGLALGGKSREVTVLFVDVRGFTPLSERVEAEIVVKILNDYLNLIANTVFKYHGMLDKFIGDAAMAVFNAPLDMADHAYQAVLCGIEMERGAKALNDTLMKDYGITLAFGVGIHTGMAVIGNIGSEKRMDYTAIGDTVNTAARLESQALPGEILISERVYQRIEQRIPCVEAGVRQLKGKTQGLLTYRIINDLVIGSDIEET